MISEVNQANLNSNETLREPGHATTSVWQPIVLSTEFSTGSNNAIRNVIEQTASLQQLSYCVHVQITVTTVYMYR